jgi:hypothetical protein
MQVARLYLKDVTGLNTALLSKYGVSLQEVSDIDKDSSSGPPPRGRYLKEGDIHAQTVFECVCVFLCAFMFTVPCPPHRCLTSNARARTHTHTHTHTYRRSPSPPLSAEPVRLDELPLSRSQDAAVSQKVASETAAANLKARRKKVLSMLQVRVYVCLLSW